MSSRRKWKDRLKQNRKTLLFAAQHEGNADVLDTWAIGIKDLKNLEPEDVYIIVNNSSDGFYQRVKRLFPKGYVINAGVMKDTNSMPVGDESNLELTVNLYWIMSLCGNMAIEKAIRGNYEHLLIMGGDDVLSPNGLNELRDTINKDFKFTNYPAPVGIAVPVIVARGTEKEIEGKSKFATPVEFPTPFHENHFFKIWRDNDPITMYIPTEDNQYKKKIFWAMGSSGMLISRDVFTKIKFEPEKYEFSNLYEKKIDLDNENNIEIVMKYKGEDYDFCYRVQEAGYKIMMRTKIFITPLK